MNPRDFIAQGLTILLRKYPLYTYKYWADTVNGNHFIEVIPSSFEKDENFIEEEILIIDEFANQYMYDSIAFITNEDKATLKSLTFIEEFSITPSWFDLVDNSIHQEYSKDINYKKSEFKDLDYNYALAA